MNDTDLRRTIIEALLDVAPEVDPAALRDDVELRDQIDIDSMDFLNFIIGLHERTGVDVPERDYPRLATINGCLAYLRSKTA